jgi:hypothetical protein
MFTTLLEGSEGALVHDGAKMGAFEEDGVTPEAGSPLRERSFRSVIFHTLCSIGIPLIFAEEKNRDVDTQI